MCLKKLMLFKRPLRVRSGWRRGAFSLIEIVLALGVAAFVLVALLSLTSVGMNSLNDSGHDTITGMVLKDVRLQLIGTEIAPTTAPVYYYSKEAVRLDQSVAADVARNYYRVRVDKTPPSGFADIDDGGLMAVMALIEWPAATVANGAPPTASEQNRKESTFLVGTGSTQKWQALDSSFQPRIGF